MMLITRKLEFCASHRLFNPAFPDEKNAAVFGHCNNPNGHGHNYTLEVTVRGKIDPETGMVMNYSDLKRLVQDEVINLLDHKNLNLDVPCLRGLIPTMENLAFKIWEILAPRIERGALHQIKLYESDKNFVVYQGLKHEGTD